MSSRTEIPGSGIPLPGRPLGPYEKAGIAIFLVITGFCTGTSLFCGSDRFSELLFAFRISVLCAASVQDFRCRRLGHVYEILIFASGLFSITSLADGLIKFISALLIFGILALIYGKKGSTFMGGADIRMLSVLFFTLGPLEMFYCAAVMTLLLLLSLGINFLLAKSGRKTDGKAPLLPYITTAVLLSHMLL